MTEHDLFSAIGYADEAFLTEDARPTARRLPRHLGLIAAMLTIVILTACAAPVIWEAISIEGARVVYTGEVDSFVRHYDSSASTSYFETPIMQACYQIEMDIALSEALPDTIETAYLPTCVPETWELSEQVVYPYLTDAGLQQKLISNWTLWLSDTDMSSIILEQVPLSFYDPEDPAVDWFYVPTTAQLENQILPINGMDVLEVSYPDCVRTIYLEWSQKYETIPWPGERICYWSDGIYLFKLRVPYDMELSTVESVISSIAVADLSQIPIVE